MKKKPEVYDFLSYHEYLREYYTYKKELDPDFSYRVFSEKIGLKTKSFIKMLLDGERNISDKPRPSIAAACELGPEETKYFNILIDYNHEKDITKQKEYFKELHSLARKIPSKEMKGDLNKVISKWYYLVVKSLLNTLDTKPTPEYISKRLRYLISPEEAKEALDVLIELKTIKEEDGKYVMVDQHLSANESSLSEDIKKAHEQLLNLSCIILKLVPQEDTEYLAVTMDVTKERMLFIKDKIKKFHQDIVRYVDTDGKTEGVCQLNIQFYKLTDEE